ncbi:peptidylprolyl isomerase [Halovulum sp. GXIMD14793]
MRIFGLTASVLALVAAAPFAVAQDTTKPLTEAEKALEAAEEQVKDAADAATEKAEEAVKAAEEKAEDAVKSAEDMVDDAAKAAEDAVQDATGAADAAADEAVEYDSDTVLATVNGTAITLGHVAVMVNRLPPQYQQLEDQQLLDGILQQMVEHQILLEQLEARGTISKPLALTVENEVRAMKAQEIANEFYLEPVSEEDLQKAYDEAIAGIPPSVEYSAAHILVETEDEAKALVEALNGGADFAELAKEKSVGPSGPNGGDLGWFGAGQMVPEFEQAVMSLEPGAISAPVQTQFGWHVVKLNETREKPLPTMEEMEATLDQRLRQQQVEAKVKALTDAAEVEYTSDGVPAAAIRDTAIFGSE